MAAIPWLNTEVTEEICIASGKLHNTYPTEFSEVDGHSDGFKELCVIIVKYDVQKYLRLRRLHRHRTISQGQILLGTSLTDMLGYWTKPTSVLDINLHGIGPYVFSMDCTSEGKKAWVSFKFRKGSVNLRNIDSDFFKELIDCLVKYGLEDTLGLEVIHGGDSKMTEFTFETGSPLLDEENAQLIWQQGFTSRVTEWDIIMENGIVKQVPTSDCVEFEGEHRQIILPDSNIVEILGSQGIWL